MQLFADQFEKDIGYTVINGSVIFYLNGNEINRGSTGEFRVTASGSHRLTWVATFTAPGSISISVDGEPLGNQNNRTSVTLMRDAPCREYQTNSRSPCRNNFRRESRPGSCARCATRYFCVPEPGCEEPESYQEERWRQTLEGSFNIVNQQTSSQIEQARLERERAAEAERRAREAQNEAAQRAAAEERARLQREIDRLADLQNTGTLQNPTRIITFKKSRYKVVTPEVLERIQGKLVPKLRYESVQELLPADVSRLIFNGYIITPVEDSFPLIASRPYAASVVKRNNLLKGASSTRIIEPLPTGTRKGFTPERLQRHYTRIGMTRKIRRLNVLPRSSIVGRRSFA